MWFYELTGFREDEVDDVAEYLSVEGDAWTSRVSGRSVVWGRFEMPSLGELRAAAAEQGQSAGDPSKPTVTEVVADVGQLHADPANAGAMFQVASQFNMLEMVGPQVTPEDGVDRYELDRTQGPACAISCGAGTIYRNYLIPFPGGVGQRADRQLDGLADFAQALDVPIDMANGYALPSADQLRKANEVLTAASEQERSTLAGHLRLGLQLGCEVTRAGFGHPVATRHRVHQAFCSAVPVAYSEHGVDVWEPLARLVLDAAYEATLLAAALHADGTARPVFLTLLGAGAFGNPVEWVVAAIARAVERTSALGLDIRIVSYGHRQPALRPLLTS